MKILITNYHLSGGGGHTTYILSLLSTVPEGFEVFVGCPSQSTLAEQTRRRYPNIPLLAIEFPGKIREIANMLLQLLVLIRVTLKYEFDVIHVNGSPDHRLVMLLRCLLPKKRRPRVIFTKHNSFSIKPNWFTQYRFSNHCDSLVLVTSGLQALIPEKILNSKKVWVIENGVDTQAYKVPNDKEKQVARDTLSLPSEKLVFISCAGTALHKGWHYLVKALDGEADIFVVLIGNKPDSASLAKIFPHGVPSQVRFTGYQEDVRPFLAAADIGFVLSTSIETASFACREMLACGLPILVSDYGFLTNNVTKSCGWVVEAGSVDSIRNVIPQIQKADMHAMRLAARVRVTENFDLNRFIVNTYNAYKELYLQ